jgi:hypothetical protein
MPTPRPDPSLELALAVVGYQWAVHGDQFAVPDPITGLEALETATGAFPTGQPPLAEVYPHVARVAALSLRVLAALGDPGEVDGLRGFEGFDVWREAR